MGTYWIKGCHINRKTLRETITFRININDTVFGPFKSEFPNCSRLLLYTEQC